MNVDDKIRKQLADLIELGDRVLDTRNKIDGAPASVDGRLGAQWVAKAKNLLWSVFADRSKYYEEFCRHAADRSFGFYHATRALGVVQAAKADYEAGAVFSFRRLVEADLFTDILDQAEHLLDSGYRGPAAVVAGCVLEDALRKLCEARSISLPDRPKIEGMNAELRKAGLYSKATQKMITAHADLRNDAAHGKWEDIPDERVRDLIAFTRRFIDQHTT